MSSDLADVCVDGRLLLYLFPGHRDGIWVDSGDHELFLIYSLLSVVRRNFDHFLQDVYPHLFYHEVRVVVFLNDVDSVPPPG